MSGRSAWPVFALAALLAAACGQAEAPGVTVTDSAGVRITLSPVPPVPFAMVDPAPLLSLGGADVPGPTQFGNIAGVYMDRRGVLWVADGQSAEVRLFNADGSFWKSVGRRGEGPGEFMRLRLLGGFRGDSVAVWDDAQGRLTVLDAQGRVARMVTMRGEDGAPPNGFHVFPDGTVLARIRTVLQAGELEPGSLIPDTAVFARVDYAAGAVERLGGAPAPLWLWTGALSVPIPFTLNPGFDVSGEAVHVTSGPAFRIRVLGSDGLAESYGLDRDPQPVGPAERSAYAEMVRGWGEGPQQRAYLAALDDPHVPAELPAYRSLVADDRGGVWAERYTPGAVDVYGSDRTLRGRVDVPLTLHQVTGSMLVGVWRDELNVEYVRIHRFRPAG